MLESIQVEQSAALSKNWFLRIEDGSVFGPTVGEVLRTWAQQGRVSPDSFVSENKLDWMPAAQLDILEMQWKVDLGDGTYYGPVNVLALGELVADGTLVASAGVVHCVTGERSTIEATGHRDASVMEPGADGSSLLLTADEEMIQHERRLETFAQRIEELGAMVRSHADQLSRIVQDASNDPDEQRLSSEADAATNTLNQRTAKLGRVGQTIYDGLRQLEKEITAAQQDPARLRNAADLVGGVLCDGAATEADVRGLSDGVRLASEQQQDLLARSRRIRESLQLKVQSILQESEDKVQQLELARQELKAEQVRHTAALVQVGRNEAELTDRVAQAQTSLDQLTGQMTVTQNELDRQRQVARDSSERIRRREDELQIEVDELRRQLSERVAEIESVRNAGNEERSSHSSTLSALNQKEQNFQQHIADLQVKMDESVAKLTHAETEMACTKESLRLLEEHGLNRERQLQEEQHQLQQVLGQRGKELHTSRCELEEQKSRNSQAMAAMTERETEQGQRIEALQKDRCAAEERLSALQEELRIQTDSCRRLEEQGRCRERELQAQIDEIAHSKIEAVDAAYEQLDKEKQHFSEIDNRNKSYQSQLVAKVKELQDRLQEVASDLDVGRRALEDETRRTEATIKESNRARETHEQRVEQFKQALIEESRRIEKDFELDRSFYEVIRGSILKKEMACQQRVKDLSDAVGTDLMNQEELFRRRTDALSRLKQVEPELEQLRAEHTRLSDDASTTRQSLDARLHGLENERASLTAKLTHAEMTMDHQRSLIEELKERSHKTDSELSRRLDAVQDEYAELMKKLSESQLKTDEMAKLRDDSSGEVIRVQGELQHTIETQCRLTEEMREREQQLTAQVDELQSLYAAAVSKLDQVEWDSRQKDGSYVSEMEVLQRTKVDLETAIQDLKARIQHSEEHSLQARSEIARVNEMLRSSQFDAQKREENLKRQCSQVQQECEDVRQQLERARHDVDGERSLNVNLEKDAQETRGQLSKQVEELTDQLNQAGDGAMRSAEEVRTLRDAVSELNGQLVHKEQDIRERLERMKQDQESLSTKLDREEARSEELRVLVRQREQEITQLKRQVELVEQQALRKESDFQKSLAEVQEKHRNTAGGFEQMQKQLAAEKIRLQQKDEELDGLKRTLAEEQKARKAREVELTAVKKTLEEERGRLQQREELLGSRKGLLDEETIRRQVLEEELARVEKVSGDNEDRCHQLEQELHNEKAFLQDREVRMQQEQDELAQRVNQLQDRSRDLSLRLDETVQELDQQRMVSDDERTRSRQMEEELKLQIQQFHQEEDSLRSELDRTSHELEQQRILYEDERDRNRLRVESGEQKTEQAQQEREALSVRLDQQKKFYDEERELRRQKEMELLRLKKELQDALSTVRQKEQMLVQQKKVLEDENLRLRQKEQVLTRRVEQMQKEWRTGGALKSEPSTRDISASRRSESAGSPPVSPRPSLAGVVPAPAAIPVPALTPVATRPADVAPLRNPATGFSDRMSERFEAARRLGREARGEDEKELLTSAAAPVLSVIEAQAEQDIREWDERRKAVEVTEVPLVIQNPAASLASSAASATPQRDSKIRQIVNASKAALGKGPRISLR